MSTTSKLINYWRMHASLASFNNPDLNRSYKTLLLEKGIASGKIDTDFTSDDEIFWVCPFQIVQGDQIIHLMWLPVTLSENHLQAAPFSLPYCPGYLFDPLGPVGSILGKIEVYEQKLHEHFVEDEKLKSFSWSSYYQACSDLLQSLNSELYDQTKAHQRQVYYHESALEPTLSKTALTTHLSNDHEPGQLEAETSSDIYPLLGFMANETPLLESECSVVEGLFNSKCLQAVQTPAGSRWSLLIHSMISTQVIQCIQKGVTLHLGLVNFPDDFQCFDSLTLKQATQKAQRILNSDDQAVCALVSVLKIKLNEEINAYTALLEKAKKAYEGEKTLQTHIELRQKLQQRDEQLEEEQTQAHELLNRWRAQQKTGLMTKLKDVIQGNTQTIKNAEFISRHAQGYDFESSESVEEGITSKIRQIKVERTKGHQQLTELADSIVDLQNLKRWWQNFTQTRPAFTNALSLQAIYATLHAELGPQLHELAECILALDSGLPIRIDRLGLNEQPSVQTSPYDLMILCQAQDCSIPQGFSLCQSASKVWVFGDEYLRWTNPDVLYSYDAWALRAHEVIDSEEMLDIFHEQGMMPSQNSFHILAEQKSDYAYWDPCGFYHEPMGLKDVWLPKALAKEGALHIRPFLQLHEKPGQGIILIPVEGQLESEKGWTNQQEIHAIHHWLKKQPDHSKTAIVVFSMPQRTAMREALKSAQMAVPVYLPDTCPLDHYDIILCSTVYTHQAPRPYRLDCGDQSLYRLLSLPQKGLIWFSDQAIFDQNMKSPSGRLARFCQKRDPNKDLVSEDALV